MNFINENRTLQICNVGLFSYSVHVERCLFVAP